MIKAIHFYIKKVLSIFDLRATANKLQPSKLQPLVLRDLPSGIPLDTVRIEKCNSLPCAFLMEF